MTLGGRSLSLGLIGVLTLIATLTAVMEIGAIAFAQVLPLLLLIAMLMALFARANFSPLATAVICVSLLAQPGLPAALARLDGPVWLCLSMLLVTASAANALERHDLRPVIALGTGLALLEAIDPMGSIIVAAFIPVLMAMPKMRANGYQAVGTAMLIMFVPVVSAVLLWQIGQLHPLPPLVFLLAALGIPVHASSVVIIKPFALMGLGAGLIPIFLTPLFYARTSQSLLSAMLALLITGCFAMDDFLGTHRHLAWLLAALLPCAVVAMSAMPLVRQRENVAMGASVFGLALAWAVWSLG